MPFPVAAVTAIGGLFSGGASLASAFGGGGKSEGHASKRWRREDTRRWEKEFAVKQQYAKQMLDTAGSQAVWANRRRLWEQEFAEKALAMQGQITDKSLDAAMRQTSITTKPKQAGVGNAGLLILLAAGGFFLVKRRGK